MKKKVNTFTKRTDKKEKPPVESYSSTASTKRSGRKQFFASLLVILFLLAGTVLAVLYASGYRLFVEKGAPGISKTGILNITSTPNSAQVYVDGDLATATNNTINLSPKKYTVRISKDGYNDWQKDVEIKAEVVSGVDALLFRKSPTLQSVSTFGVEEAIIDPSGTKLAFKIASQSAEKNGIYVFDMTARSLPILQGESSANQIADDTVDKFSEASISWSPDSRQLLASIAAVTEPTILEPEVIESTDPLDPQTATLTPGLLTYYLLKTDGLNENPEDTTATITLTESLWQTQLERRQKSRLRSLKPKQAQFASKYFKILSWSPDDKKILYQASESATMPVFLTPRRIGNNLLYERRDLKKDAVYVYDTTEDVNTRIVDTLTVKPTFTWFPDSEHLIYLNDKKIQIVEKDGSNLTTVYAGPFLGNFVYPWPDGTKIVILTNLNNPTVSPTLYTVGLK